MIAHLVDRRRVRLGRQISVLGGGSRHLEAVPLDQELRQRPAEQARDDQPHRRDRDPALQRRRKAVLLGDGRPPGDRRAVPADQRDRPDDHAGRLRHAERHRADGADQVLQEHEGDRDEAEDAEDAPARRQIREPGIHPDRREEDDEQPVPRRHVEADVDPEDGVHPPERQGGDEATGDRFRDAVAAQERHPLRDEHADEEDDDADGQREEVGRDEFPGRHGGQVLLW